MFFPSFWYTIEDIEDFMAINLTTLKFKTLRCFKDPEGPRQPA